ncbi:hypothetical protein PsYK624_153840 [Phanerochaete sordida]|uniref:Reverse transcriptase domain-containing protein n=1 Tax=Phanerochaete sordida TaxID=48140 RepID=A0A9P3GP54_9APHY|nr:hypothetical protein PsYK624_153840 [Phanerochaete sordida]
MLCEILRCQGFSLFLVRFLEDYLANRSTTFLFNGFKTASAPLSTEVGQGSALSPVLTNLYLAPVLRVVEVHLNAEFPSVTLQFYVDDGLIHVFSRKAEVPAHLTMAEVNKGKLKMAIEVMICMLLRGPLVMVRSPGGEVRYLGFLLDSQLSFQAHIRHYANRVCSTVASLKLLGNSVRGLGPKDKRRLYIAQSRAACWISGAFRTTPIGALNIAAGLLPVWVQINKFLRRACLRVHTLHRGHPLRAYLPNVWAPNGQNINPQIYLHNRHRAKWDHGFIWKNPIC